MDVYNIGRSVSSLLLIAGREIKIDFYWRLDFFSEQPQSDAFVTQFALNYDKFKCHPK